MSRTYKKITMRYLVHIFIKNITTRCLVLSLNYLYIYIINYLEEFFQYLAP